MMAWIEHEQKGNTVSSRLTAAASYVLRQASPVASDQVQYLE
jgi:hypothetical protein